MASNSGNSGPAAGPILPRVRSRQNTPPAPASVAESSNSSLPSVHSGGQGHELSLSGDITNTGPGHDHDEQGVGVDTDGPGVAHGDTHGNHEVSCSASTKAVSDNGQAAEPKWRMTPSMMQAYNAMRGPRNEDHDDDSELDPLSLYEKRRKGEFKMNSYRSDPLVGHIERQEEQKMFVKPSASATNSMIADVFNSATGERPQKDDLTRKGVFYYDRPEDFKHLALGSDVEFSYPKLDSHDGYGCHSAWSANYQKKGEEKEDVADFNSDLNDVYQSEGGQALVLRNPTPVTDADHEEDVPSVIRGPVTDIGTKDHVDEGSLTLYLQPSPVGDGNQSNQDPFSALPSPLPAGDAVWEYKDNVDGDDLAEAIWAKDDSAIWGGSTVMGDVPGPSTAGSMPDLSGTGTYMSSTTASFADFMNDIDDLESDDGEGDHNTGRISPCTLAFLAQGARHHTYGAMPKPVVPEDIGSQRPTTPEPESTIAAREQKRLERLNFPKQLKDDDSSMYGTCSFYSVTTNPSLAWSARGVDPEENKKHVDTTFDRMDPAAAQVALVQGGVEIAEPTAPDGDEFYSKDEVTAALTGFDGAMGEGVNAQNLDHFLFVTRDAIAVSQQKEKAMDHTIKYLEKRLDELTDRKEEATQKALLLARKRAKDAGEPYVPPPPPTRGGMIPLPPPGYAPPSSPGAAAAKGARIRAQIARQVRELRHVLGVRSRALERKRETRDELCAAAADLEREIAEALRCERSTL
ncbi:hypothetical protein B0T22DRAFT_520889 [Podospora appendiculata]|uniref:Uncharacterized protein n=1 Tax=Podospora appendiculata TaxID=314037 RepID=A0AAE0X3Q8_9PEZI|nr:hypothetical protein B0T22DRAFT_520889 [Podospora appendiculata]